MSLTSKLHPEVSPWFVNFDSNTSHSNFAPFIQIYYSKYICLKKLGETLHRHSKLFMTCNTSNNNIIFDVVVNRLKRVLKKKRIENKECLTSKTKRNGAYYKCSKSKS